jgi:hypothetical protein
VLACSDSLSSLDLSGCFGLQPSSIETISQLTNLTDLGLVGCKKAGLATEVGKIAKALTKLVNLRLASTALNQAGALELTKITTLRLLDLSWCQCVHSIHSSCFSVLTCFSHIFRVTDDTIVPLVKSLTRLDCLKLFGCRDVSDELCLGLERAHPTLNIKKST